tara:strand:- start:33 stop:281 length:249 start_codon:yes stop_codon:yes gene_type:complete
LASERAGDFGGGVEPVFEPAEGSEGADDVDWARITRFLVVCDPPRRYTPVFIPRALYLARTDAVLTSIAVIEADFRRHSTLR